MNCIRYHHGRLLPEKIPQQIITTLLFMPNQGSTCPSSPQTMPMIYSDAEMDTNENSYESDVEFCDKGVPDSPLDLTINSIRYPSAKRPISNQDPLPLSETALPKPSHIFAPPMVGTFVLPSPLIVTQPKAEWHYRSMKDLAKKHIPYLSGDGPQRTPIRIKVPPITDRQLYLAVNVVTIDDQCHVSKVIVPPRTSVIESQLSRDNNLARLNFDACNPTDYFDPSSRCVYFQINSEECAAGLKEVRFHMFNLYQNHMITKDIIESNQLDSCKLAFWFCVLDNNHFEPVSLPTYSVIIRESKLTSRPRVSQKKINQGHACLLDPREL
ncbi:unnamed protein product [Rotaria socialis]|uniref:Uncharacterized protein n=1 Tax=Rotaria socialis TaxID=392032 RepID=A0A817QBD2_9BILA|nr:unnamed protein product [Rotaria socialis]CAF4236060.1 unnamed protein product [Rotaria socialis]